MYFASGGNNGKEELYNSITDIGSRLMDALSSLSQPVLMIGLVIAVIAFISNLGKGLLKAFEMFLIVIVGAFILAHIHDIYAFISSIVFNQ
ncbi:MAG: hypothetical protein BSOLF_0526 [Candidatus Carbobacillus altaicus]|uniref:Uncharacterized protein n=1 Tax=Candidatus Carbonibacillus altaicus TaxID=2163959 RepID=A0A2R6Y0N9_9BACL|nr:MAG: hypothetical protein BSOLF_0526 [Candidatus Carbobacillus altaicus]